MPALTAEISAPALTDRVCCWAGLMARSALPINDHGGIVFHAGGPDSPDSWLNAAGR